MTDPNSIVLLRNTYSSESLNDVERDVSEALDARFTRAWDDIPEGADGFHPGTFTLELVWRPD